MFNSRRASSACEACPLDSEINELTDRLGDSLRQMDAARDPHVHRAFEDTTRLYSASLARLHRVAGNVHMQLHHTDPTAGHEASADHHFAVSGRMHEQSTQARPFGTTAAGPETHKTAPIGGLTLDMDVTDHIDDDQTTVPRTSRRFNSSWTPPTPEDAMTAHHNTAMSYMHTFLQGTRPEPDRAFNAITEHVQAYADQCPECRRIRGHKAARHHCPECMSDVCESGTCHYCTECAPCANKSLKQGKTVSPQNFNTSSGPLSTKDKPMKRFKAGLRRAGQKLAEVIEPRRVSPSNRPRGTSRIQFTEKNTPFQNHYHLNKRMKKEYETELKRTGEQTDDLADRYFGSGAYKSEGPDARALGNNLSQYNDIRWRVRVPHNSNPVARKRMQIESLSGNPGRDRDSEWLTTADLLREPDTRFKTTHFDDNGVDRSIAKSGLVSKKTGEEYENRPLQALTTGAIITNRLYHETIEGLKNHPDIKVINGRVDWNDQAKAATVAAAEKLKRDVFELHHGSGITLANGTRKGPLFVGPQFANLSDDLQKHFEPHPDDAARAEEMHRAFHNVSVGTDVHRILNKHTNPLASAFDISLQREISSGDNDALRRIVNRHLNANEAPMNPTSQDAVHLQNVLDSHFRELHGNKPDEGDSISQLADQAKNNQTPSGFNSGNEFPTMTKVLEKLPTQTRPKVETEEQFTTRYRRTPIVPAPELNSLDLVAPKPEDVSRVQERLNQIAPKKKDFRSYEPGERPTPGERPGRYFNNPKPLEKPTE